MAIRLVVGLGNPGREYEATRHNIGFRAVEALAASLGVTWKAEKKFEGELARAKEGAHDLLLLKPSTYMNDSGRSVGAAMRFYKLKLDEIVVVYDEIQLDVGQSKLSVGGGAGGHNGITDLIGKVGGGFLRYRLGVGPKTHPEMVLKDFVLGKFSAEEEQKIVENLPGWVDGLRLLIDKGPVEAMNRLNRRVRPAAPKAPAPPPSPESESEPSAGSEPID